MCRVAVRNLPPRAPLVEPSGSASYAAEGVPAPQAAKPEEGLDFLFEAGADELELDPETGADLLAMFGGQDPADTVLGQPVDEAAAMFVPQPAVVPLAPAVQALQMGALAAYPVAPPLQAYQHALLQQQAMLAAETAPPAPRGKRGKSADEVEEQQERIKKRRRESAQRSRARKNQYMRSLEVENEALKAENDRLHRELLKVGVAHKVSSDSASKLDTPAAPSVLHSDTSGVSNSGAPLSDSGLCGHVEYGLAL